MSARNDSPPTPPRSLAVIACAALMVVPMAAGLAYQARPAAVRSQLVWFDRAGKRGSVLGTLADYGNVELSPDGQRVAVAVLDQARGTRDIWMYDVASGRQTTFTSNPADENWLIWSPDGKRVVFNSQRSGGLDLYQSSSRAGSPEDVLLVDKDAKWPVSWSADGRFILYVISGRATGNDIFVLPLFGDRPSTRSASSGSTVSPVEPSTRSGRPEVLEGRKPYPFLQTAAAENWAAFSPDGRWVAYSSDESGQSEVYVAPFPAVSGRAWRISSDGGSQARWRRDGRELFYLSGRMLMSVAVDGSGSDFTAAAPQPLFGMKYAYGQYHAFDVTADGQRFLVNSAIVVPGGPSAIAQLQN